MSRFFPYVTFVIINERPFTKKEVNKMGLKALLSRECICPHCHKRFWAKFNKVESTQGGKNDNCPSCRWLLWIPIRGSSTPIPIPIYIRGHA